VTVATEGVQQVAAKGLGIPLDKYVKRDKAQLAEFFADVHPTLVEAMMYNGSLYLLPTDFNAVNMYYDPILFAQHGFGRPKDNWTRDEFYKIAKAVTKKKGSQTNTFGYAWVVRLWGSWTPWIDVAGGDLLQFGRAPGGEWLWSTFYKDNPQAKGRGGGIKWGPPTANSATNVEALQFMQELTKEGIAPVPSVTGGNTLQGFFASKKLAMTPAGGFWAGGLHSAGFTRTQFDVQYFPRWRNQRTHFGTAGKMILKSSQVPDAAWEFCKFFASKEAMEIELAGNSSTPTRRSMMTAARYAPTGPAHWQVFYPTLDHDGTRAMPAPTYYNAENNSLVKYTTLAMGGSMSAKQALDGLQGELERLYASSPH
jgi:ABC-type glycerol-3-phosphate transport system substrate-binding protein